VGDRRDELGAAELLAGAMPRVAQRHDHPGHGTVGLVPQVARGHEDLGAAGQQQVALGVPGRDPQPGVGGCVRPPGPAVETFQGQRVLELLAQCGVRVDAGHPRRGSVEDHHAAVAVCHDEPVRQIVCDDRVRNPPCHTGEPTHGAGVPGRIRIGAGPGPRRRGTQRPRLRD
jgi:hypothetical protein